MAGKRILIVTASVGSGHEKAAMAIAEGIRERHADVDIVTVDFMAAATSRINALFKYSYLNMLRFVPNLYEFVYQFTSGKKKGSFVQNAMASVMSRSIKNLIKKHRPELIICTHPFPADAVSHLSEEWRSKFISAAVITDYSVHPMWICPNMNMYFVASETMKEQLIDDGIRENTIFVTGIPISLQFSKRKEAEEARCQLGIDANIPAVVLMGGGLGLGGMDYAINQLESIEKKLQLLVVTGKNSELKSNVESMMASSHHDVKVWGYTDQVHAMMSCADVLITKPGALTLTEAACLGLPMVLNEPIPGPETDNARFMSENGAAVWLHSGDSLAKTVSRLINNADIRESMGEKARNAVKEDAAAEIAKRLF